VTDTGPVFFRLRETGADTGSSGGVKGPLFSGTGRVCPAYTCRVPNILNLASLNPGERGMAVNMQVVKWCVDLAMGIAFLFNAVTGTIKLMVLWRIAGFSEIVLPVALISEIHDRAGIALSILVLIHLILNRAWILSMTRKILAGTTGT
jgi:hypothetical protein